MHSTWYIGLACRGSELCTEFSKLCAHVSVSQWQVWYNSFWLELLGPGGFHSSDSVHTVTPTFDTKLIYHTECIGYSHKRMECFTIYASAEQHHPLNVCVLIMDHGNSVSRAPYTCERGSRKRFPYLLHISHKHGWSEFDSRRCELKYRPLIRSA